MIFYVWVGTCTEIVHTKFRDLRGKIAACAVLVSLVPNSRFVCTYINLYVCTVYKTMGNITQLLLYHSEVAVLI